MKVLIGVMEYFVDKHSIVRTIWGRSDIILFIFAGASAEFALNKAVDWLYFTGRLPADPIGRLFSTVSYARTIVFSENQVAENAIKSMAAIHAHVEAKRGTTIPDWAYRDVLFMLIDYSIRVFEMLERALSRHEKDEVFNVFNRVGVGMGLRGLPGSFDEWETMRQQHLIADLQHSTYTDDLFDQYKKHLGTARYRILLEAQTLVVPSKVRELLDFRKVSFLYPLVAIYRVLRYLKMDGVLRFFVIPVKYQKEVKELDTQKF